MKSDKYQVNFKISWASNFGSKIWAKLQAKPNFSSQLLGVNGILKFENSLTKFINFFLFKKGDKGTWITKPSPYLPLDPTIPSHVQGACDKHYRAACVFVKFQQILKFHEWAISALKFELSGERSQILLVNS